MILREDLACAFRLGARNRNPDSSDGASDVPPLLDLKLVQHPGWNIVRLQQRPREVSLMREVVGGYNLEIVGDRHSAAAQRTAAKLRPRA